ncbi:MAG: 2-hydroxyacid dehydrogenase [Gemmatimonadaceae bacterium]
MSQHSVPEARERVLVTHRLPVRVEAELRARFDVQLAEDDAPLTPEALARGLAECDAILPTVTDRMPASFFARSAGAPPWRCRIIANFGVGVNHIALEAASAAGIVVTNTPDVLTQDTADLTILLMLTLLRRSAEGERELRAGRWTGWRPTHLLGRRLSGRTLGIVGFGRIGRAVAQRARLGFGMHVLAWTRTIPTDPALRGGVEFVPALDALLPRVDILSLHCPASPETRHLLDARALALLRPEAVLINAARGDVVDEAALVDALERGRLAGAALDVFEHEPAVHPGLLRRDDVVLLPHQGSGTVESREAMGLRAMENLFTFFAGAPPRDRVV